MCGLGGVYREDCIGAEDVHDIIGMARRSVERGRDATGFMVPGGWWKIAQRSTMAVEASGLADWLEKHKVWDGHHKWLMFHTRAMTRGSPRVSSNNHPMVHGKDEHGIKLIHNGNVREPDYYGYNVVDTRSLAYMMHKLRSDGMSLLEATRTTLVSIYGRAAICVSDRYGEEFVVMKDANGGRAPLFYYWNKRQDRMQFSSTRRIAGYSMIGSVGKKHGSVREYELDSWQALWWSGGHEDRLKRIWHLEKHGGELLERVPLPNKIDLHEIRPRSYEDGGKFALHYKYNSNYKSRYSGKKGNPLLSTPALDKTVVPELFEISEQYKDEMPVSNIVMYPVVVPVIENEAHFTEVDWFRFQDHLWSKSLRAELIKIREQDFFESKLEGKLVVIMLTSMEIIRYDEYAHTMFVLLNGNITRKYFRSVKKRKLVCFDIEGDLTW